MTEPGCCVEKHKFKGGLVFLTAENEDPGKTPERLREDPGASPASHLRTAEYTMCENNVNMSLWQLIMKAC